MASAQAGNVVAGGDWAQDDLILDLVRPAGRERPPHPAARPWRDVVNPLGGYLLSGQESLDTPELAGGWNFGAE